MIADRAVVDAISASAGRAGAKLMIAWVNTPDGVLWMKDGEFVEAEIASLAKKMKKR